MDIIPFTKVQYNKRHLMTSAFLTLTKDQGHTTRLKGHRRGCTRCLRSLNYSCCVLIFLLSLIASLLHKIMCALIVIWFRLCVLLFLLGYVKEKGGLSLDQGYSEYMHSLYTSVPYSFSRLRLKQLFITSPRLHS